MKNIVLIGMMGAGKTTVGKKLSACLKDFSFIDMDSDIEKNQGVTISKIFQEHGESYFRDIETEFLKKYCAQENLVISTGGGIVERAVNIEIIKKNSVLFYLSAPAGELFERIKHSTHRPLLDNPNPYAKIKELLNRRVPYYKMADFEIETLDKEVSQITDEILEKYKSYEK